MDSRLRNEPLFSSRVRMQNNHHVYPFESAAIPETQNTTEMRYTREAKPILVHAGNSALVNGQRSHSAFPLKGYVNTLESFGNKKKCSKGKPSMVQTKRWVSPRATNTPVQRSKKQGMYTPSSARETLYHNDSKYIYKQPANEYNGLHHGLQANNHLYPRARTPPGFVDSVSHRQKLVMGTPLSSYDNNLKQRKLHHEDDYSMVHTPSAMTLANSGILTPTVRQKVHQQRSLFEKLKSVVLELSSSSIADYQSMERLEQQLEQYSNLVKDQDKMLEDIEQMNAKLSAERDMLIALRNANNIAEGISSNVVTPIDKRRNMIIHDPSIDVLVAAEELASIHAAVPNLSNRGNQKAIIASLIQNIRDEKRQRLLVEEQSSKLISEQQLTITRLEQQLRELKQRGHISLRENGSFNSNYTHPHQDVEHHSRMSDRTSVAPTPEKLLSKQNGDVPQPNSVNNINAEMYRGKGGMFIEPSEFQSGNVREKSMAMNQHTCAPMRISASSRTTGSTNPSRSRGSVLDEFEGALSANGFGDPVRESDSPRPYSYEQKQTLIPHEENDSIGRNGSHESKTGQSSRSQSIVNRQLKADVIEQHPVTRPYSLQGENMDCVGMPVEPCGCDNNVNGSSQYKGDNSDRASVTSRLSLSKRSSIAGESSNPFDDALEEIRRRHNL